MSGYPVIEQNGYRASVSTQKEPTGRWMAWVDFERDRDLVGLSGHRTKPHRVPNDYPSEEKAVAAAYARARELIANGKAEN